MMWRIGVGGCFKKRGEKGEEVRVWVKNMEREIDRVVVGLDELEEMKEMMVRKGGLIEEVEILFGLCDVER